MAPVERRYLAPLNPGTTITEADRSRLNDLIRERLSDTLTGNESYLPEGVKKDPWTLASDLRDLIASLSAMQMQTNDPSDVLGQAIAHLQNHAERFDKVIKEDEPTDQIELPREQTPTTSDNNVIYVDPNPGLYSPPLPQRRSLERRAALNLPNDEAVAAIPASYRQLTRRAVNSAAPQVSSPIQTETQQVLELLSRPMSKRPYPLIFDTDW
jgi:hypothetical protein